MSSPDWPERKEWIDDYTGPSYDYKYVEALERRYAIAVEAHKEIVQTHGEYCENHIGVSQISYTLRGISKLALAQCPPLPEEKT